MAHPTIWPNKLFFYAFGNTPAVCLTSDLPPDQPADILLLGSGDARNVLYTIYADLGKPSRRLDFTCCDIEPAVFARNVLLYTLLADLPSNDGPTDHISKLWNFYYHFFIDDLTLKLILDQCQRLVEMSTDIQSWNVSQYGRFLRFSTSHCLSVLRKHWKLYVETKSLPEAAKKKLVAEFRRGKAGGANGGGAGAGGAIDSLPRNNTTSIRSAGPLWMRLKYFGSKEFDKYWESGTTFEERSKITAASQVNPTFAYSAMGRGFGLHYGSDPILSFHLAKGLAPLKDGSSSDNVSVSMLVETAKAEFMDWCLTFHKRLVDHPSSFTIRLFVGDAIAVCRALHFRINTKSIETGYYTMPWSSTVIKLDGGDYKDGSPLPSPLQFDVIDTSNLTDHLGLLNILLASRPVMRLKPSSILHTNTLHHSNEKGTVRDGFLDYLCGDISTMSLLLDLIPVSYVSNFTTHSNVHEVTSVIFKGSSRQFYERVSWRIGSLSDSSIVQIEPRTNNLLQCDEKQLASLLYGIYLQMFNDENMNVALQSGINQAPVHYVRLSYAYLLRFIKDRVSVKWNICMAYLNAAIADDKTLMVGSNNLGDLYCSFHMVGVFSYVPFTREFTGALTGEGILKAWGPIPPVVCITILVPRAKFKVLDIVEPRDLGTLAFICSLVGKGYHACYQNYHCHFGDTAVEYPDKECNLEPDITFIEDPNWYNGTSPVVFTFYVPTYQINNAAKKLDVVVSVRPKASIVNILNPILGQYLSLFQAPLLDRKNVHITRERPGNPGEVPKMESISFKQQIMSWPSGESTLAGPFKVALDKRHVTLLTGRTNVVDTGPKSALENKASIDVRQTSPQAMRVSFDKYRPIIPFPFPIVSADSKTRIARKSGYIEVDVKIANPLEKSGMWLKPLPIIRYKNTLSLWNMHYLDLSSLPALDLSSGKRLAFVKSHVTLSSSDREKGLIKAEAKGKLPSSEPDVAARMKQNLARLCIISCGLDEEAAQFRVFGLSDPDNGGMHALLFINDVRLDLASHTVVLDACVLPLTKTLSSELSVAIKKVHDAGVFQVVMKSDEVRAWKHLLPVYAERCRQWSHNASTCEYLTKGVIPASVEIDKTPLCSCGRGKHPGDAFTAVEDWKPFAPHVTRAAISPLFAVPLVDAARGDIFESFYRDENGGDAEGGETCAMCGGNGKPRLLVCSVCKKVSYCSPDCQRVHWKVHKRICKRA